jgi:hypothetical protein
VGLAIAFWDARMSERRTNERRRRLKSGTIVFNNASSVYSCGVKFQ